MNERTNELNEWNECHNDYGFQLKTLSAFFLIFFSSFFFSSAYSFFLPIARALAPTLVIIFSSVFIFSQTGSMFIGIKQFVRGKLHLLSRKRKARKKTILDMISQHRKKIKHEVAANVNESIHLLIHSFTHLLLRLLVVMVFFFEFKCDACTSTSQYICTQNGVLKNNNSMVLMNFSMILFTFFRNTSVRVSIASVANWKCLTSWKVISFTWIQAKDLFQRIVY